MREYVVREYDKEDYEKARAEMTEEKALETLESIERGWLPDYNYSGEESDYDNFVLHLAMWKAQKVLQEKINGKGQT